MAASSDSEHAMNPLYRAAIHQLFLALDLPTPNDEEAYSACRWARISAIWQNIRPITC